MSNKIVSKIKNFISGVEYVHRDQAVSHTLWEERELENIFTLLLMGSFSGIPAPPAFISAELIPLLTHELKIFNNRAENSFDTLAEMTGVLGID
ncbi:MAG TPA: hypothetical protein DCO79_15555 [Spirochaeta sp.]|nr:hypothetical protein [Spirochaeta sp.]